MDDAATNLATYDLTALLSVGVTVEVYRGVHHRDCPYSVTTFVIPLARS